MHITTFSLEDAKTLCQILIDYGVTFSTRSLTAREWGFEFELSGSFQKRYQENFMREIEDMLLEEPTIEV